MAKPSATAEIAAPWWSIAKAGDNAYAMRLDCGRAGDVRRVLLLADIHWDSSHCERELLRDCLNEAKALGAPVIIAGDFFDAMQGKWDPRSSQEVLRPEHRGGNYLDLLVSTAAEWLMPWKDSLAIISYGNHETSIRKRHEVDLLQRLCQELRREGSRVECGPYWAFVVLTAEFAGSKSHRDTITLCYHHGAGGGGEITRGLIDHSRTRSMYLADVYLSGHIHRRNQDENILTTVTARGVVERRRQLFLRASCWKDESSDGWHVQMGRAARPIGGWWLELHTRKPADGSGYSVDYRAVPT